MSSDVSPAVRPSVGDSSWFTHDRFGLFIHWGLYALAARHEWMMKRESMTIEQYTRYFDHFDPDLYDPALWADAAANAGMKYFAVTTKHHEGFCLWDTALTDWKAPNTPARRDLLKPMVDAFRARNMRVGLYHSLIDWHHPHFKIDRNHPLRNHPDRETLNESRDQSQYAKYLHGQVRELLDGRFGPIDMLWLDFSYRSWEWRNKPGVEYGDGKGREDWQSEELLKIVRQLQPQILINDRLDLLDSPTAWDFKTPEQWQPPLWLTWEGQRVVWEVCHTFSGSWGYHRDEQTWKTVDMLVQMLIDAVSKGGNLILNVGPTGRGEFDARALDRLSGIGKWMKYHNRSIYGCTEAPAEFPVPPDCRYTWNPATRRLYVHLFNYPFKHVYLHNLGGRIEYAQFLHDASEVTYKETDPRGIWEGRRDAKGPKTLVALDLPEVKPDVTVPVVEVFLKG